MTDVSATAEFHQLLRHQPSLVWYDASSASAAARARVGAGLTQAVQLPS